MSLWTSLWSSGQDLQASQCRGPRSLNPLIRELDPMSPHFVSLRAVEDSACTTKISHAATMTQCSQINKSKISMKKKNIPWGELSPRRMRQNLRNEAESHGHPGANLICSLKYTDVSYSLDSRVIRIYACRRSLSLGEVCYRAVLWQ